MVVVVVVCGVCVCVCVCDGQMFTFSSFVAQITERFSDLIASSFLDHRGEKERKRERERDLKKSATLRRYIYIEKEENMGTAVCKLCCNPYVHVSFRKRSQTSRFTDFDSDTG